MECQKNKKIPPKFMLTQQTFDTQGFIQLLNVARLNDSSISLTRLDNLNFRESQT